MRHESEQVDTTKPLRLKLSGDWIWRIIAGLLLVANLWAKTQYVSLSDYKADHSRMTEAIINLQTLVSNMEVRNERIADHELRLRALEFRQNGGTRK
jgi:hypothetical protein